MHRPSRLTLTAVTLLSIAGCSLNAPKPLTKAEDRVTVSSDSASKKPGRVAADACYATAVELEAAGKEAEAVQQYERASKFGYDQSVVTHRIAVCYDKIGDERAANAFEKAIMLNAKSADVYCDHGFYLYGRGKLQEAELALQRAIQLDQQHHRAGVNLALVYGEQRRYDDSFRQFEKYVGAAAAHANLGVLMARHGNNQEARLAFERSQAADPTLEQPKHLIKYLATNDANSNRIER